MPQAGRANSVFTDAERIVTVDGLMSWSSARRTWAWFLLAGLILRAATPLGYMPASLGSGLLFELCPGQLPAGVVLRDPASGHEHHHRSADDSSPAEPDACQVGHLLSSTAAPDDPYINQAEVFPSTDLTIQVAIPPLSATRYAHRSRGPPA